MSKGNSLESLGFLPELDEFEVEIKQMPKVVFLFKAATVAQRDYYMDHTYRVVYREAPGSDPDAPEMETVRESCVQERNSRILNDLLTGIKVKETGEMLPADMCEKAKRNLKPLAKLKICEKVLDQVTLNEAQRGN